MQIDEFLELVRKRRSIRQFKPDPIPDDHIEKILEAARAHIKLCLCWV